MLARGNPSGRAFPFPSGPGSTTTIDPTLLVVALTPHIDVNPTANVYAPLRLVLPNR